MRNEEGTGITDVLEGTNESQFRLSLLYGCDVIVPDDDRIMI